MSELVKYEAACRAVADAASIDEAKDFRDKSEAMRAYAKQAKNKQLEVQAAEIRIRAERRIGELMNAQRDAGALATAGRPSDKIGSKTNPISAAPTLAEVGIDKKLADRARKYAAIPEDEFNGIVNDWKGRVEQENERVTVNLLAAGQKAESAAPIDPAEDGETAKARKALAGLTRIGLEDEVIGLRADLADAKSKIASLKADNARLKEQLADLTNDDRAAVIRKLQASLKNAENAKWRATEDTQRAMKQVYALKKRVEELEQMGIPLN
ncbi:hypothetical protein [Paenirhodobacter enshiensis]|uniref:hypothetical protein n=1 Tax=Paenirhodobacter enshiensis TaxID=1105367 RepID=UPI0035AF3321